MATLGDLLGAARASAGSFQAWLVASDPQLAGKVASAAEGEGLTSAGFVRAAVADFARFAPEEDWATLVSSMRDDADPGTVCLLAMVHWRLTATGCRDHGLTPMQEGAADERPLAGPTH